MEYISLAEAVLQTGKSEDKLLSERIESRDVYSRISRLRGEELSLVCFVGLEFIRHTFQSIKSGIIRLPSKTIKELSLSDAAAYIDTLTGPEIADGFVVDNIDGHENCSRVYFGEEIGRVPFFRQDSLFRGIHYKVAQNIIEDELDQPLKYKQPRSYQIYKGRYYALSGFGQPDPIRTELKLFRRDLLLSVSSLENRKSSKSNKKSKTAKKSGTKKRDAKIKVRANEIYDELIKRKSVYSPKITKNDVVKKLSPEFPNVKKSTLLKLFKARK